MLLSDAPRQTINGLTLYAVFLGSNKNADTGKMDEDWWDLTKYLKGKSFSTQALTLTTMFTVTIFVGSAIFLLVAALCYIPLLMKIRGNLKACRPF